jgi:small subunit ribosomal protein S21
VKVYVKDGNVERAIRQLKKKLTKDNRLQTVRDKEWYEKPTWKRKAAKEAAKKRWQRKERDLNKPKF